MRKDDVNFNPGYPIGADPAALSHSLLTTIGALSVATSTIVYYDTQVPMGRRSTVLCQVPAPFPVSIRAHSPICPLVSRILLGPLL